MIKQYLLFSFLFFYGFACFSQSGATAEKTMQKDVSAYSKGDYKQALHLFQKCAVFYKKSGNIKLLGKTHNNLGNAFSRIGKSEQALTNYLSAIIFSKQSHDSLNISRSLLKWGYVVREDGQTDTDSGSGIINGSSQLILDGKAIGTITGDALNGSFKDDNNRTITIAGKRTL